MVSSFNRGLVSALALGRIDLERLRMCAETCLNWMPHVLGPMSLRPGLAYIDTTKNNAVAKTIPFIAATTDAVMLVLTDSVMRVMKDDAYITRPSVSTTVTNGDMSSSTGWTVTSSGDATGTFAGGLLTLACPSRGGFVTVGRSVTVAGGDQNVVHELKIIVTRGPLTFRCGTASGDDSYVTRTELRTGEHHLAFTPTGNFYVEFESDTEAERIVDSCQVSASGVMEVAAPWLEADLGGIRHDQSADVIFAACAGYQQRRIERRDNDSWSIVLSQSDDGPFSISRTAKVRIRADDYTGNTTLTADSAFFKTTHVGSLFRIFTTQQKTIVNLARDDVYTVPIRVFGYSSADRTVSITRAGTWVGTLTVQRSYDGEEFGYDDVTTHTTNGGPSNQVMSDADGAEIWVRVGFKPGEYTSGTATVTVSYSGSGGFGIARVTEYNTNVSVDCEILRPMRGISFTEDWREGQWSEKMGFPSAVAFYEGRLWWFGKNAIWGSVSDAYESHDEEVDGDSGPLNRTIGSGPVDNINWALALQRLLIGTDGNEVSIRSNSFDEPISPTQFNLKDAGTAGSARVAALKVDQRGFFVQAGGVRLKQIVFDSNASDYQAKEADILVPDIGQPGVSAIAVQRQPETRVYFVRDDGVVIVLIFNPEEDVSPLVLLSSAGASGEIEDVCVLPGQPENSVYFVVKRTVNGSTVRYIEKMATFEQSQGDEDTRLSDSHVIYDGGATTTISGLDHLEGEDVVVWADGVCPWDDNTDAPKLHTVTSGDITLDTAASYVVAGLPYEAQYKSAKMAYAAAQGSTAMGQKKKINYIGLSLYKTHPRGLEWGGDFTTMDRLAQVRSGAVVDLDAIIDQHDEDMTEFPADWDNDARLCLQAQAPLPVTVLAVVVDVQTSEHR